MAIDIERSNILSRKTKQELMSAYDTEYASLLKETISYRHLPILITSKKKFFNVYHRSIDE